MARRALIALGSLLAVGLAAAAVLDFGENRAENARDDAAERPNIVVVMTDDQTVAQMRALPRTRRLIGDAGVSFERFYVTDPLCCPSRATFFTGQYAHNHGVISNGGPNALAAFDERETLAVWLRGAGYRTAFVGKYLNGYGADDPTRVPPGWSDWRALVEPSTQDYVEYDLNLNGTVRRYGPDPDDYKTTVLGDHAVEAIRRAADGQRPWFLYLGFNAPHAPSTPATVDSGSYAGATAPRSPAFDEADLSDKPGFIRDREPLDAAAIARIDSRHRRALESLVAVDRQVERVVEALRRLGELESTYLVFTSDNGYLAGEHGVEFGKLLPYDPASRVPLLIRGPGIASGSSAGALTANIDLAPTIAELARAEPTLRLDGRSLVELASDPEPYDDRPLLIESLVRDRSTDYGFPYGAVRTQRHLYVRYSTGDEELYDLRRDPFELESLAADPRQAGTRARLAAVLAELRDCAGPGCRLQLDQAAPAP